MAIDVNAVKVSLGFAWWVPVYLKLAVASAVPFRAVMEEEQINDYFQRVAQFAVRHGTACRVIASAPPVRP